MPFCTLLSAKESRPYDLPNFGQCLHPAFKGAEVLGGTLRHLLKFGGAQAFQQVDKTREVLANLFAQSLLVD
jgi:hypothetical protein